MRSIHIGAIGLALFVLAGCGDAPKAPNVGDAKKEKGNAPAVAEHLPPVTPQVETSSNSNEGIPPDQVVPPRPVGVADALAKKESTAAAPPPPAPVAVDLNVVDLAAFKSYLAGLKGKVVVIDVWATWCIPCRQNFPKFVKLSHAHERDDVVFVTLSGDTAEEVDAVKEFLGEQKAKASHYLVTNELSETQDWLEFEALPRYFVIDKEGKVSANTAEFETIETTLTVQRGFR